MTAYAEDVVLRANGFNENCPLLTSGVTLWPTGRGPVSLTATA